MDFYQLFQLSQIKAIGLAIEPTLESIYMARCREYSIRFHTPLDHVVNNLDAEFVLDALNQDFYNISEVREDLEGTLDILYKIKDPNYRRDTPEETEAMVDNALNYLLARQNRKKRPTEESIQADIRAAEKKPTANPKSGKMSFGDLEKMDALTETNKAGFDEA